MKRQSIVEGDRFKSSNGTVWIVLEAMKFGRGYWIGSEDRCRQTIMNRHNLESSAESSYGAGDATRCGARSETFCDNESCAWQVCKRHLWHCGECGKD